MSQFEERKVFIGNLPLHTTNDEVAGLLHHLVGSVFIEDIKLVINKNRSHLKTEHTKIKTLSAIVTVLSSQERDHIIKTFASNYPQCRMRFYNLKRLESMIYISKCYPLKSSPEKTPQKESNELKVENMTLSSTVKQMHVDINDEQTKFDDELLVLTRQSNSDLALDNDSNTLIKELLNIKKDNAMLLSSTQDLEINLKDKCPSLFISMFEFLKLQEDCSDLENRMKRMKTDCEKKKAECKEIEILMEELSV